MQLPPDAVERALNGGHAPATAGAPLGEDARTIDEPSFGALSDTPTEYSHRMAVPSSSSEQANRPGLPPSSGRIANRRTRGSWRSPPGP